MSKTKNKKEAEKFQHQLLDLLKEDANRVCADCRARGPRWASWNLGVFICIRCAGIHRNLGVHISKVRSVNLDTWTQEQVDNMLAWGNGIGNEFYEYKLPADFRRPTNDQTAEKFIRSKYDKKLYCHDNFDYASSLNKHSTPDIVRKEQPTKTPVPLPVRVSAPTSSIPVVPLKTKASEAYIPPKLPAVQPKAAEQPSLLQVSLDTTAARPPPSKPAVAAPAPAKPADDLFDLFGEMVSAPLPPKAEVKADSPEDLLKDAAPKQSVKDSIMSLYSSTNLATSSSSSSFPSSQQTFPAQFNQQQFNQAPAQQQQFAQFQGTQGNPPQQFQQQFQAAPQQQQQFQQFGNQQMLAQQQQAQQQLLNQLQGQNMAPQNMQNFQQPAQQQFPQQFQQSNMQFNGFQQAPPAAQQQQFFAPQGQQQQFGNQQFAGQQMYQQPSQQSQLDAVQKQLQGLKVAPPMQQAPQMWNFGTS